MPSSAEDVAEYLEDQGIGTRGAASGWAIFIGKEPSSPNNTITVYDTGGAMGNPDQLYDPTIQIRIRGHDYSGTYAKAVEIRDDLVVNTDRVVGDWHYAGFFLISDIAKIDTDENNRDVFTINFRLMREPNSTA